MASSFSTDTKLELIATGEKAGLWGTITNTNLQILEQSATGYLSQSMASGDVTLTLTNGATSDGNRSWLKCVAFWANMYEKGDAAQVHNHKPSAFSFAYFLKCEDDHAKFVFTDSGYKITPKEGTFVAFPAYLNHHVEEHKADSSRITLSGNFEVNK